MPTRNINLTEHFDHFVEHHVSSGRYGNASEIVREALRLLEEQEQQRQTKLKTLRQAAKQGFDAIDQGKGIVDGLPFDDAVQVEREPDRAQEEAADHVDVPPAAARARHRRNA